MKFTILRIFTALLVAACLLPLAACDSSTPDETAPDTPAVTTEAPTEAVTLSPEEQLAADRQAYLDTVTYRDFVLTGEEAPYYMGRWFDKDIEGTPHKVTLTDGAHLYFLIENAASFDVTFTVITTGEEPYFAYSIDGAEPIRQHITEPTVTLPDNGRHTVRIIADGMTEGEGKWDQEKGFAVKSVTPSEGGSIIGIRPTEKVIFFYGDSITEGIRALNMNATSDGNSATNAYSWQCAETLGVTPYLIGYGASGIIMPGSFHTMLNAIDYLSDGRPVEDGVIPDVIVVNHGTNDGGQNRKTFEDALTATLTHLREKYPDTPIVYLIPFNQAHSRVIPDVVEAMGNAYVVETRGWSISYTDGVHPDAAGAKAAGERLAAALVEIFGEDYIKN
jgi:lysophospholipase L1-like esterase